MVSLIDFVENYSFKIQNKIHSMHWHSYQCTIFVHISWMQIPNFDPNDEDSKIVMRYHFYIYDDKTHDSYFVQHCLFLHWENMMKG
jgi:hypothetical protein